MDFSTIKDHFTSKCKEILNADQIKTQDIILLAKWFRDLEKATIMPSNVNDFVVLIINFFLNLHKFSELKKFETQFLTTFRVSCGTILHVIDVLNIHSLVIKRCSRIIKLITTQYAHSVCTKELLKVFNVCLGKATNQVIETTADKHKIVVCNLYKLIEDTSDVEMQFVVLEAVLRFFHTERLRSILYQLAPKNENFKKILESKDSDLYGKIRLYINELNQNSSRIFSIKCNLISLESAVVESLPNKNLPIKEAWLDFDLRERKISFFCNKEFFWNLPNKLIFPTITEWEVVSFYAKDKIKIDFTYCDGASVGTIKLMIKLNTRNINLFCDTQSEMVKTIVIVTSVDSPESDKFTSEILPETFPDSFNLDANSQVSSYHALSMTERESETPDLMLSRVTSPEIRFERDKFLKIRTASDEELERSNQRKSVQQDDDYFGLTPCHVPNDRKTASSDDCFIYEEDDAELNLSQGFRQMFNNYGQVSQKRMSKGPSIELTDSRSFPPGKVKLSTLNRNRTGTTSDSFRDDQSVGPEILSKNVPKLSKIGNHIVLNKSISPMSFARSMKSPAVPDILTEESEYREAVNMQLKKKSFTKLSRGAPMSLANYSQCSRQVLQPDSQQSRGLLSEESFVKSSENVEVLSHKKVEKWLSHSGDASKYSDLLTEESQITCIGDDLNEIPPFETRVEPLNRSQRSPKQDKERVVDEFHRIDFEEIADTIDPILKEDQNEDVEVITERLFDGNRKYQAGNRKVAPKMSKTRNDLTTLMSLHLTNDEEVADTIDPILKETRNGDVEIISECLLVESKKCQASNRKVTPKMSKNRNDLTTLMSLHLTNDEEVADTIDPIFKETPNGDVDIISECLLAESKKCQAINRKVTPKMSKNRNDLTTLIALDLTNDEEEQENYSWSGLSQVDDSSDSCCRNKNKKKFSKNKRDKAKTNKTGNSFKIKSNTLKNIKNKKPKRDAILTDGDAIRIVNKNTESSKKMSNCIVVLEDVFASKKKRFNGFNCLPLEARKKAEEIRLLNERSMASTVSSGSEKIALSLTKSLNNEEKPQSPERVTKKRKSSNDKKNKHDVQDGPSRKSSGNEDGFKISLTTEDDKSDQKNVIKNRNVDNQKNKANGKKKVTTPELRNPENTTKRRKSAGIKKNEENLICQKLDYFPLDSQSSNDASKTLNTKHVDNKTNITPSNVTKRKKRRNLENTQTYEASPQNLRESPASGKNAVNLSLVADYNDKVTPQDVVTSFSQSGKNSQSASVSHDIHKIVAHVQCKDISTTRNDCILIGKTPTSIINSSAKAIELSRQDFNRSSSDATKDKVNSTLQSIFMGLSDSEGDCDMLPLEPMRTNELIDVLETHVSQGIEVEEVSNVGVDSSLQDMFKDLSGPESDADLPPLEPMRTNELIDVLETQISQRIGMEEVSNVSYCSSVASTLHGMFQDLSGPERDADLPPLEPMRTNELLDVPESQISQQLKAKDVLKPICPSDDSLDIPEPSPTSSRPKVQKSVSKMNVVTPLQHSQHQESITEGEMSPSFSKSSANTVDNRGNRKDTLETPRLKITKAPKYSKASVKRNTRKLFNADDMSYLDECLNDDDKDIWEAKIKEQEQVVPNATSKKQAGTSVKKTPKIRGIVKRKSNSKKRAVVSVLGHQTEKTDVSLAKTQEQIMRLRQIVQEKKRDSAKKRKIRKDEDSDSDVSVRSHRKLKKAKINIISNVVLKPLEQYGTKSTSQIVLGKRQYKEFQVENLVNALSFATGRDLSRSNLSKELLVILDKYL